MSSKTWPRASSAQPSDVRSWGYSGRALEAPRTASLSHDQPSNEVAAAQTERLESTQNGHSSSLTRTTVIGSQSGRSVGAINLAAPPNSASADAERDETMPADIAAVAVSSGETVSDEVVSEEDLVRLIQEALMVLRYDTGPPDGRFGSHTASAIRAYQRDYHLGPDGRPSRELFHHMKDRLHSQEQRRGVSLSHTSAPSVPRRNGFARRQFRGSPPVLT